MQKTSKALKGITIARVIRGFSQWQLSDATGIKNHRLSWVERGRFPARPAELKLISEALDMPVETLTADEGTLLAAFEGAVA